MGGFPLNFQIYDEELKKNKKNTAYLDSCMPEAFIHDLNDRTRVLHVFILYVSHFYIYIQIKLCYLMYFHV